MTDLATSKVKPIDPRLPKEAKTWKSDEIKGYIQSFVDTRRDFISDKRKDLIVLGLQLEKATKVPLKFWLHSFEHARIFADIHPCLYNFVAALNLLSNK